jgi:hypothetical protein
MAVAAADVLEVTGPDSSAVTPIHGADEVSHNTLAEHKMRMTSFPLQYIACDQ